VNTEAKKEYWREYARKKRATDPAYNEYHKAAKKEWRKKNPNAELLYARRKAAKHPGYFAEIARQWRLKHPGQQAINVKACAKRYPEKIKARNQVNNSITAGKLVRLPCEVCGNVKSHAHHFDYKKPLQIVWLCRKHHMQQHRKKLN
jgi:hypothetical protein